MSTQPVVVEAQPVKVETQSVLGFSEHVALALGNQRSNDLFVRDLRDEVLFSVAAASACTYAKPKRKNDPDPIIGPSARFAEAVYRSYRNLMVESRTGEVRGRTLTAVATAYDMERVNGWRVEVTRSIMDSKGNKYSDHMIVTTQMAAQSIARRNVILNVVPSHLWTPVWHETHKLVEGKAEDRVTRVRAELKHWKEYGFQQLEVAALVNREGVGDISGRDLLILRAFRQSIVDGDMTPEDFREKVDQSAEVNAYLDKLIQQQADREAEAA